MQSFTCDFRGCKSKPFSSKADLRRHQLAHDTKIWYSCAAENCLRKGKKGFYRADKLNDHMLAAHDNDTLCACPDNLHLERKCVGLILTRDIMAIHAEHTHGIKSLRLNLYRDCPLPKCPYRIYHAYGNGGSLDPLQEHLINKHDATGRKKFTDRIRERGYDAATGEIICPICLGKARFADHSSFHHHFFAAHFDGPATGVDESGNILPSYRHVELTGEALRSCTFVPDGVRQCRRTILSLWPKFSEHPVWEDVKFR